MATTVPKEPLRALVASLAGLPEAFVVWDGEPKGPVDYAQDARRIVLNVVARRRVGEDEEVRAYPTPSTTQITYRGQRALTVSVRAENYGAQEGFDLLEDVRTVLGGDASRATLNASDLSLSSIADVRNLPGKAGNRAISVAQMDLILNQLVTKVVTLNEAGYIETVEMSEEYTE